MRALRLAAAAIFILAAIGFTMLSVRAPKSNAAWEAGLERRALFATVPDGRNILANLRAFEFTEAGAIRSDWATAHFDNAAIKEVWFFIEPFSGNDAFAHSFLSFVIEGAEPRVISVSVEARRETGEKYSALAGLFRSYELSYVWSTEKDILTRIALDLGHPLHAYRLDLGTEHARAILAHFIRRTNDLIERPRFYNTLFSNCTNELAKAVNDAFPGALPWHPSYVLTGTSDAHLHRLGFINEGTGDFAALRAGADIAPLVARHAHLAEDAFAAAWRDDFHSREQGKANP